MPRPHTSVLSNFWLALVGTITLALAPTVVPLVNSTFAQTFADLPKELREAIAADDYSKVIELTKDQDAESPITALHVQALQRRGEALFFTGKIKESIHDFDAYLNLVPEQDPHHWQRGISYYYAEEYAAGQAQFERHQKVNTQDVENAVWHFLCAVRTEEGNVETARKNLIPIERDSRVPMKQVHDLFAGKATAADVLEVSKSKNDKCYAHLYLGLYYEGIGDNEKAQTHIELSANDFRQDHYMGKVAQVHAKLRGWKSPLAADGEAENKDDKATEQPTVAK